MKERVIAWFKRVADKKWMIWFLGANAFLESIFFLIPMDIFIFTLAAAQPKKWIKYATVTTVWSVIGAVTAYFLAAYFFDAYGEQLLSFYGYEDEFVRVTELFEQNVFWVMFTAAFTPIPYKVFAIAGGVLNVALLPFIIASILGRGLRFFIEAYIPYRFGEQAGKHIMRNFNYYTIGFAVLVIVYFIVKYLF